MVNKLSAKLGLHNAYCKNQVKAKLFFNYLSMKYKNKYNDKKLCWKRFDR